MTAQIGLDVQSAYRFGVLWVDLLGLQGALDHIHDLIDTPGQCMTFWRQVKRFAEDAGI